MTINYHILIIFQDKTSACKIVQDLVKFPANIALQKYTDRNRTKPF